MDIYACWMGESSFTLSGVSSFSTGLVKECFIMFLISLFVFLYVIFFSSKLLRSSWWKLRDAKVIALKFRVTVSS